MRKKLLALGMSFLFGTTLIISGCGNSNDGNVSEPTVENTAAPAEDSQSSKENAKWKVGLTITDLTVPVWEDYANAVKKYGEQEGMYVNIVSPEGNAAEQIS